MNSSTLFAIPFFAWWVFILAMVFVPGILFYFKKRKVNKEEALEDIMESGVEDPQPFRPLSDGEKLTLAQKFKFPKWVAKNRWWLIPLFILVDIGMAVSLVLIPFVFFAVILELVLLSSGGQAKAYFKDISTPVFRVQGRALKQRIQRRGYSDYYLTVRKVEFSQANYPTLPNFFNEIADEQEVAVEYCPNTKFVLSMTPVAAPAAATS